MTAQEKWKKAQETRKKRKNQVVKIYDLKLVVPRRKREALKRVFLEAKWFYNWVVADIEGRLNDPETEKAKVVEIKVEDRFEERELKVLPAQVKQEMLKEIRQALKALSTQKKNGRRVGRLKFKSKRTTVPFKQPGNTFKFLND